MIQSRPEHESCLNRFWPALLIGAAWLWLFLPMMTGKTVVGFRDSAYLYYPLFKWIDAQWAAGEIPLWNPYCNLGLPVVADGTSSVFYPGKLVFFCRFLSFPARYGIYLAIHIPIAAAGTYWFARTLRANCAGATLAAFSFSFGGSVLFQVTNVIYLVSAAWLPFAFCCVWKMVKTGEIKWAVAAGVCCALMILGGDPQMVYHVGLIAVATIVGEFLRRRRRRLRTIGPIKSRPYQWLAGAGIKLGLMVMVTGLLAAIQLLPTYPWAQRSERTNPQTPANIYMVSIDDGDAINQLIGHPTGTVDHAYQFSQPPWSVIELLWPNISGKPFPIHQRMTNFLPGADRVWVPSLYVGLPVILLGIGGLRFWGPGRKQVWLSWLMTLFLLGSFGWYGAVWLFNEFASVGDQSSLGPQVGGVYWAMNMLLPKYFAFRYPAKLFVIASLAISLLAAVNLRIHKWKHVHLAVTGLVLLNVLLLIVFRIFLEENLTGLPSDPLFGCFDSKGAARGIYFSVLQSIVVAMGVGYLMWHNTKSGNPTLARCLPFLLVGLTAVDVLLANSWLVPTVDSSVFESRTHVAKRLAEIKNAAHDAAPIRVFRSRRQDLEPVAWQSNSSKDRLSQIVQWHRESLFPKHHLEHDVVLIGSFSSIWPSSYEEYLTDLETRPINFATEPFHALVAPGTGDLVELTPLDASEVLDPPSHIFRGSEIGSEEDSKIDSLDQSRPVTMHRVTEFGSNRFVARVSTSRSQRLMFSRIADRGWKAKVRNLSTDEVRQVLLEFDPDWETTFLPIDQAGEFEIQFNYRPIEFWIGAWISGCGWALVLIGFAVVEWRKISRPR